MCRTPHRCAGCPRGATPAVVARIYRGRPLLASMETETSSDPEREGGGRSDDSRGVDEVAPAAWVVGSPKDGRCAFGLGPAVGPVASHSGVEARGPRKCERASVGPAGGAVGAPFAHRAPTPR